MKKLNAILTSEKMRAKADAMQEEFTDAFECLRVGVPDLKPVEYRDRPGFWAWTDGGFSLDSFACVEDCKHFATGAAALALQEYQDAVFDCCDDPENCDCDHDDSVLIQLGVRLYSENNSRKMFPGGSVYVFLSINTENPYYRESYDKIIIEDEFPVRRFSQGVRAFLKKVSKKC